MIEINNQQFENSFSVSIRHGDREISPCLITEISRNLVGGASIEHRDGSLNYSQRQYLDLVEPLETEYVSIECLAEQKAGRLRELDGEVTVVCEDDSASDLIGGKYTVIGADVSNEMFEGMGVDENGDPDGFGLKLLKPARLKLRPLANDE